MQAMQRQPEQHIRSRVEVGVRKILFTPLDGVVDFSLIRSTQTISGAHPASYSMQRGGSIPEGNANGTLANQ